MAIYLDGKRYEGNSLSSDRDGRLLIDGRPIEEAAAQRPSLWKRLFGPWPTQAGRVVEIKITDGSLVSVKTAAAVVCRDVQGNVTAGGSVTCGEVRGSISAGGAVKAGNVGGSISAGGSVRHG